MNFKIKVENADRLIGALNGIPNSAMRRVQRSGMMRANSLVSKEMKRLAPRDSKLLSKSIGSKVKTYSRGNNVGVVVGIVGPRVGFAQVVPRTMWLVKGTGKKLFRRTKMVKSDPVHYAHLVDRGTKPHSITFKWRGRTITVRHPGAKAKPFVTKALENVHVAASAAIVTAFREGITARGVR